MPLTERLFNARLRRENFFNKLERPAKAGLFFFRSVPEKPAQKRAMVAHHDDNALELAAFLAEILSPRQLHIPLGVVRPIQLVKTVQTKFRHVATSFVFYFVVYIKPYT